jgi:predicted nucleic acid-binding protein
MRQIGQLRRGVVMCTVALQEFLVTADEEKRKALLAMYHAGRKAGTLVNPTADDWIEVGKILNRLLRTRVRGTVKPTKAEVQLLVRDALIARCALRAGCVVVTHNIGDFKKLQRHCRIQVLTPKEYFGVS